MTRKETMRRPTKRETDNLLAAQASVRNQMRMIAVSADWGSMFEEFERSCPHPDPTCVGYTEDPEGMNESWLCPACDMLIRVSPHTLGGLRRT
jgi:hypothetical protein